MGRERHPVNFRLDYAAILLTITLFLISYDTDSA